MMIKAEVLLCSSWISYPRCCSYRINKASCGLLSFCAVESIVHLRLDGNYFFPKIRNKILCSAEHTKHEVLWGWNPTWVLKLLVYFSLFKYMNSGPKSDIRCSVLQTLEQIPELPVFNFNKLNFSSMLLQGERAAVNK